VQESDGKKGIGDEEKYGRAFTEYSSSMDE
jgi:hypothetical protein